MSDALILSKRRPPQAAGWSKTKKKKVLWERFNWRKDSQDHPPTLQTHLAAFLTSFKTHSNHVPFPRGLAAGYCLPPTQPCKNVCSEFCLCFQTCSPGQLRSAISLRLLVGWQSLAILLLGQPYVFVIIFVSVVLFVMTLSGENASLGSPLGSLDPHLERI